MTREEMDYDSSVLRFQFDKDNGIYALDNVAFGIYHNFTTKNIFIVFDEDDFSLLTCKLQKASKRNGKLGIKLNPSLEKQFNQYYKVQY